MGFRSESVRNERLIHFYESRKKRWEEGSADILWGCAGVNQWDEEMLTLWRLINKHETMRLHAASRVNIIRTCEQTFRVYGERFCVLSNFRHISLLIDFLKRWENFENCILLSTLSKELRRQGVTVKVLGKDNFVSEDFTDNKLRSYA